jgi:hypothetical protein
MDVGRWRYTTPSDRTQFRSTVRSKSGRILSEVVSETRAALSLDGA